MPAFIALGDLFWFAAGFAICWFFKDPLTKLFLGTKAFSDKLRAKADAISAAVKKG